MEIKIEMFNKNLICHDNLIESFQGWKAYAKWANSYKLINRLNDKINN